MCFVQLEKYLDTTDTYKLLSGMLYKEILVISPNISFHYNSRGYRPLSRLKGKQKGSERINNNDARRVVRRGPCKGSMCTTSQRVGFTMGYSFSGCSYR